MIKSGHSKYARFIFDIYLSRLLRKSFSAFYVMSEIPVFSEKNSAIVTPNHFSWWDGFFIDYLNTAYFKRKFHIMMLEEQLKKYRFFNKLGAYSIFPGKPSVRETISYTRKLLTEKENLVVIYPQGEIEPIDTEPLLFNEGLKLMMDTKSNFEIAPAAFKIEYSNERIPAVFCRFGKKFNNNLKNDFDEYVEEFNANMRKLKMEISSGMKPVHNLFNKKFNI